MRYDKFTITKSGKKLYSARTIGAIKKYVVKYNIDITDGMAYNDHKVECENYQKKAIVVFSLAEFHRESGLPSSLIKQAEFRKDLL